MPSPHLQSMVRLVYFLYNFLIIYPADLRTEIGTTMPRITELLHHGNWGVREASINTLSKFVEYCKTTLF